MAALDVLIDGARNTIMYEREGTLREHLFKLFATNHSPASQARDATRAAVLPAEGAYSERPWLQEPLPCADRVIHRCRGI